MKKFVTGKWRFVSYPIIGLFGLFFLPVTIGIILIWFSNEKISNKSIKYSIIGVLSLITFFFGSAYIAAFGSSSNQDDPTDNSGKVSQVETTPDPTWTPTTAPNNSNISLVKVARVIDGDTIEIEGGQRVRYIGMDTPELGENPDCYAIEAFEKNKELVENGIVGLEKDVSDIDRYGRLLRYVYMGDLLINDVLVRQGYANASSYSPDVKYQDQFTKAEREARENNRGLWASCQDDPTPTPTPAQTTKPVATATPAQAPVSSSGSCKYSCTGADKDCSDFSTHAEAQAFFNCCGFTATNDPMRLDKANGIGDGIACESLP